MQHENGTYNKLEIDKTLCDHTGSVQEFGQREVSTKGASEKHLTIQICYMQTADCFLQASTTLNLAVGQMDVFRYS